MPPSLEPVVGAQPGGHAHAPSPDGPAVSGALSGSGFATGGAPFVLRWRCWSRLIAGSAGAFRYRALVGMRGIPSHAHSVEVAQHLLGSSGVKVEFANPKAVDDPDDERELFVAVWCAHPDLIPDDKILAIPEPEEEHDGGSPLYLRPWEIIHTEVLALRYLV